MGGLGGDSFFFFSMLIAETLMLRNLWRQRNGMGG